MKKDKAVGLFRLRLNGILQLFNMHGLGVFIPEAINEIVKLADEYRQWRKESDE